MSATQDYVSLDWIKGEIAQILEQAQHALESVAGSPDDAGSMRSCLTSLHQVYGTMKMVELAGPVQVAEEMEQLAQALMNKSVPDLSLAQEILMQTILQMPPYLDRIQREQSDSEKNYLPLVNNLREARGEPRIGSPDGESGAIGPNLSPVIEPPTEEVIAAFIAAKGELTVPKLKQRYQHSLAALLKKTKARENLSLMGKVFTMLAKLCGESPMGNLAQLGIALIEGVAAGAIKLNAPVVVHMRAINAELTRLSDGGGAALSEPVSTELVLGILKVIEGASKETEKIIIAKGIFSPSLESDDGNAEEFTMGPDDETLAAVANILIEEVKGITDKLELYVLSRNRQVSDLVELLPGLEQIASTLLVVDLSQHHESVSKQIGIIKEIEVSGNNPDEEVLLELAKDLLEIESTLGSIVGRDGSSRGSFGDLDEAQAAVIKETRKVLAQCRDSLIDFVSTDFDRSKIKGLPAQLSTLRGGLLIVNQARAGDVLVAVARFIEGLLKKQTMPELSELDDLADAIASIDYYLERLIESAKEPYLQMLEVAEAALERLGHAVGAEPLKTESEQVETKTSVDASPGSVEGITDTADGSSVPADVSSVPADGSSVPADGSSTDEVVEDEEEEEKEKDLIDDEILEIFTEEVEEVLETINEYLPQWQKDYDNEEALTEVRKAFHTLKGSGRMVGATVLGELAWSVENVVNGIIDKTIQPDESLVSLMLEVVARIPEGLEYFKNQNQHAFLVDELVARAEALATGEEIVHADEVQLTEEEIAVEFETPIEGFELETIDVKDEIGLEAEDLNEILLDDEQEKIVSVDEVQSIEEDFVAEFETVTEDIELETLDVEDEVRLEEANAEQELSQDDLEEIELASLDSIDEGSLPEELAEGSLPEEPAEGSLTTEELAESEVLGLDEIFSIEANDRLEVIRKFLLSHDEVNGDLVAAFHTLKGSAAMAEIPSISAIAGPLEHLANQYLTKGKKPDSAFSTLVEQGSGLISTVIGNLTNYRQSIDGMSALMRDVEITLNDADQPVAAFDFAMIKLLSEERVVPDIWQEDYAIAVHAELEHTREQAELLGQTELQELTVSLLRIYNQVKSNPDEALISVLRVGHDRLVSMFDQIASNQTIQSAGDIISILNVIDLGPMREVTEEVTEEVVEEVSGDTHLPVSESQEEALPEDQIDEDILPIFLEEAEELLEGIDQSILDWSEDSNAMANLDNLLRYLHTLKGSSRMAGMNSLGEFTHNFESFLIGVQQNPVPFDEGFFASLNQQQDEITRRVEIYGKLGAGEATSEDLASLRIDGLDEVSPQTAEGVEVLAEAVPATEESSLHNDEIDEDVLPIFLEETEELLEGIDKSIQSWSEDNGDTTHLDNLLRHLHTFKGGARMAGMNSLGEFTHNFETFLIGIQQNPVDLGAQFFALLNQRQDEITRRVEIYAKLAIGEASEEELQSLTIDVTGQSVPETPDVQVSTAEPQISQIKDAATKDTPAAPPQEMVRVSADLLEELIGLAGESNITRGRVEQQILDFGDSLQEMEETIVRIRDQVRRLEIEAESRETLLRSQSTDGESTYDELEMDRYTMLQEISRTLNESSSDMLDLKDTLVNRSRDAETLLHQQARIGSELQEGLTRTRMVSLSRLIPRLRRIVRQTSAEIGKSVRFHAFNIEGELDRSVLERIVAPLEHMLRNAVDHGIESPEKRIAAGKHQQGSVSLRLSREGGYVVLTVGDDGAGIDIDGVRRKAIERGMIKRDTTISDQEVMQFIMEAGFSTAQKLTQISGRGVGMDVVTSEIKALGGTVSIVSTLGVGSEFTIRIPFTVSINRALMIVVKDETYAVPLNTIEGIVRVSPYELEAYYQPEAPMFEYAGQPYRLDYMGKMLDKSEVPDLAGHVAPLPVILARSGGHAVALQVDQVIGSREVVVKTLGPQFNEVGGVTGATVLGDGSVVIILDVMALVRTHNRKLANHHEQIEVSEEDALVPRNKTRMVMIVDDSVTVRKVTTRLMERQGWEVRTAKDGIDAVDQLQDVYPDVVLLDIEMPRMDGFGVLRSVRRDERLKDLPIIMITSRTGEKHKQEALELGVNRYLGKPFQEANLLSIIEEVLSETAGNQGL